MQRPSVQYAKLVNSPTKRASRAKRTKCASIPLDDALHRGDRRAECRRAPNRMLVRVAAVRHRGTRNTRNTTNHLCRITGQGRSIVRRARPLDADFQIVVEYVLVV